MSALRVVIDTNVIAGALIRNGGPNRAVIRACLEGRLQPIVGQTLFLEYEDVICRSKVFRKCPLSPAERNEFLNAFLSVCDWVRVYFLWRPNLPDEGDNHIVELAVAGGATVIVTSNVGDFVETELKFPAIRVLRPAELIKEFL